MLQLSGFSGPFRLFLTIYGAGIGDGDEAVPTLSMMDRIAPDPRTALFPVEGSQNGLVQDMMRAETRGQRRHMINDSLWCFMNGGKGWQARPSQLIRSCFPLSYPGTLREPQSVLGLRLGTDEDSEG